MAQVIATVVEIKGRAFAKTADGRLRPLKEGDQIMENETIVSSDGSQVMLRLADGREIPVGPGTAMRIDSEVAAAEKPGPDESAVAAKTPFKTLASALTTGGNLDDLLEPTAAGPAGSGQGNEGHSFVEFLRIVETVDPQAYRFGTERAIPQDEIRGGALSDLARDGIPALSISGERVSEGDVVEFQAGIASPSSVPVTLNLQLNNGTAASTDYSRTSVDVTVNGVKTTVPVDADGKFSVTLPAGQTKALVAVQSTVDKVFEGSEDFTLTGTASATDTNGVVYTSPAATGTGAIVDDGTGTSIPQGPGNPDLPPDNDTPALTIVGERVSEGDVVDFQVNLGNPSSTASTINLQLVNGTATGGDYSRTPVDVTINGVTTTISPDVDGKFSFTLPAGQTAATVSVRSTPDNVFEGSEQFTLQGSATSTAGGSTFTTPVATGTGTIIDDGTGPSIPQGPGKPDLPPDNDTPTLSIVGERVRESELVDFQVSLSNPSASSSTISLQLVNGTGAHGATGIDYNRADVSITVNGVSTSVFPDADGKFSFTLPAGTTSATVSVKSIPDSVLEGLENFTLQGSATSTAGGATFTTPIAIGTGEIMDAGIVTPSATGPDNTVNESGLRSPTDSDETQSTTGSFTVVAPDGIKEILLTNPSGAPVSFTVDQLNALPTTPLSFNTGEGTLTLTGYSPNTGVVDYSYKALAPIDNDSLPGATPDHFDDVITLTVIGQSGTSGSDDLVIRIVDDQPLAKADTNTVTEDSKTTATGNVIETGAATDVADVQGADTAATISAVSGAASGTVGGNTAGTYGTLVLNSTGGYTYTLANTNPAVQALKTGESLVDTFTYTIRDADGDTSTTTLTITINGQTEGIPTVTIPNTNGAEAGDNTIVEAATPINGTFTISTPDGLGSLNVGGTPITPAQLGNLGTTPVVINTGEGTLTLTGFNPTTGVVSYTYSAPAQNSPTDVLDTIPVIVTDTAGVTATDNLDILIKDTAPVARPDTNSVTEDTNTSASGNVINAGPGTDTLGADATVVSAVSGTAAGTVGGNTAGTYGTLALSNTGGYTYTLANTNPAVQALKTGESLVDTFTYTIRDADGDTSTTTLTITINGQTDAPTIATVAATGPDHTVYEHGLLSPADATEIASGSFNVGASDGIQNIVLGSTTVTAAQLLGLNTTPITINTGEGSLVLNAYTGNATGGIVNYTYTTTATIDNDTKAGATATYFDDQLTLTVNSIGGQTASDNLIVRIMDDVPTAGTAVQAIENSTTNLMLILDMSSSMTRESRLDNAKTAIQNLISAYDGLGDVRVSIVTFNETATQRGAWMTASAALSLVAALSAADLGTGTNYDAALAQAMSTWSVSGAYTGANIQNVSYFISDGKPTSSDGNTSVLANSSAGIEGIWDNGNNIPDLGLSTTEENVWTNWLSTNQINSFSLGVGNEVVDPLQPQLEANLDQIAYNGATSTNTDAFMVLDPNDLNTVLVGTVSQGNLLTGNTPAQVGADGGYIQAITVGAIGSEDRFTWNPVTNSISTTGAGASSHTFNTTTHVLSITTANAGVFSIDMDTGDYTFVPTPSAPASFAEFVGFTLIDNDGDKATGQLALLRSLTPINGTAGGETLTGTAGADVIDALAGNDTINAGAGNDWISGGAGADTISGGAGNDILVGGTGADTFKWALADAGTAVTPAVDRITDFNFDLPANGGDILDLRDLLPDGATTATALGQYLDFAPATGTTGTVVNVHPAGAAGAVTQQIILEGVDLTAGGTIAENTIITNLLTQGKLITD